MTPPDEPGIWQHIAQWLWGVLLPAGWWAWKKQDSRLERLEQTTMSKADFAEHKRDIDKTLEDRRQDVKDIYREMGEIRKDLNAGIGSIKDILLSRK